MKKMGNTNFPYHYALHEVAFECFHETIKYYQQFSKLPAQSAKQAHCMHLLWQGCLRTLPLQLLLSEAQMGQGCLRTLLRHLLSAEEQAANKTIKSKLCLQHCLAVLSRNLG
uniref:Uncharacterized protein n=1 Tax=Dunaliella tertiolecta TaxID=3047 RepID=A0A7S3VP62_DUNTE